MHLCLISPGHLATNPRLVKEANALVQAGHAVSVISGRYLPWACAQDDTLLDRRCRRIAALPFGPHAPFGTRIRQLLLQRLAQLLFRLGVRRPSIAALAWHPLVADLVGAARSIRADLYLAHYPAALPAAAAAAAAHGTAYAFDAEDFHPGDDPDGPASEPRRQLLSCLERQHLPGCLFITAASPGIARAYAATYGLSLPTVVRNVFPLVQAPERATPQGTAAPGPSIYWFSQTIGPDRGLECAVRAIAIATSRPHLHLRGFISPAYRAQLLALARRLGVGQRVLFHPPAPPQQMERLAAAYDIGLVAETGRTLNHRLALANKLFSYALAGIPMLLSDIPAHRDLQSEAGAAVRLFRTEDPESLAEAIDGWLAADPSVLARARAAAFRLGQELWNWDREQRILLDLVQSRLQVAPGWVARAAAGSVAAGATADPHPALAPPAESADRPALGSAD